MKEKSEKKLTSTFIQYGFLLRAKNYKTLAIAPSTDKHLHWPTGTLTNRAPTQFLLHVRRYVQSCLRGFFIWAWNFFAFIWRAPCQRRVCHEIRELWACGIKNCEKYSWYKFYVFNKPRTYKIKISHNRNFLSESRCHEVKKNSIIVKMHTHFYLKKKLNSYFVHCIKFVNNFQSKQECRYLS